MSVSCSHRSGNNKVEEYQNIGDASRWLKTLHQRGFSFPNTYMVIDLETSGIDPLEDFILQFGYMVVDNGQIVQQPTAVLLDWTIQHADTKEKHEAIQEKLIAQMYATNKRMTDKGLHYRFTYDKLHGGVDPIILLRCYLEIFKDWQKDGKFFLVHNGYRFDLRLIETTFKKLFDTDFRFNTNQVIDTGLFEKGLQLKKPILPKDQNHMVVMYYDIADKPYKVSWSLSDHCVHKYDIQNRYNLDMSQAHAADFDCLVTHYLYQTYRTLALENNGEALIRKNVG